jgi:hypothetical protein
MISLFRTFAPAALALATLVGSLGVSQVASADEVAVVAGPRVVAERGFEHGPRRGLERRGWGRGGRWDHRVRFHGGNRFHGRR